MTAAPMLPAGTRVVIERDEVRWPAGGSWTRYRGRRGTVVRLNRSDREVGVVFGYAAPRRHGRSWHSGNQDVVWFALHEVRKVEP